MVAPKGNRFAAKDAETASERIGGRARPSDVERWTNAAAAKGLPLWTWIVQTLNGAVAKREKSKK